MLYLISLFAVGGLGTSLGWRQVVNDYRRAVSKGDDVAPFFKNLDQKNIRRDSNPRGGRGNNHDNNNDKKYTVNIEKLSKGYDSVYVDGSSLNDDLDYQSIVVESENEQGGMFSSSADESGEHDELKFSATPHHSATNNDNDNNKLSRLSNVKQWITENSRQDSYDEDKKTTQRKVEIETKEASVQTHNKSTVDSGINTRTVSYENVLHVSISAPGILFRRFPELSCSVALGSRLTNLSLINSKGFVGFLYSTKLDFEGKYVLQSRDIIEGVIRVGFHPNENAQMFAFSTTQLVELNIKITEDGISSQDEEKKAKDFLSMMLKNDTSELIVKSTVDDKNNEMKFNQQCDSLTIRCQIIQSTIPFTTDRCVETISLNEFVDDIIRTQRHAQLQRCRSACVETEEKPVYTESDLDTVRDDLTSKLQALKCDYDERIESLLLSAAHSVAGGEEGVEGRDFVHMASSPMMMTHDNDYGSLMTGPSFTMRASATTNGTQSLPYNGLDDVAKKVPNNRSTTMKGETRGTGGSVGMGKPLKFSQQWGKGLPANFLTRVCQFQEASQQYHQQLKDRTTISVSRELAKKLKAEKKLVATTTATHNGVACATSHQNMIKDHVDGDVIVDIDSGISIDKDCSQGSVYARDLYLPAVFMPFKVKRNKDGKSSGRSYLNNMNLYKNQNNQSSTALQKLQLPLVLEKLK